MIYVLAILSLGVGLLLGAWLARRQRWGGLIALVVLGTVLFGIGIWQVNARSRPEGFDGVAEIGLLFLALAPLELGALIGAGLTALRRRTS
ncbi:hypothetical protein E4Z66_05720 [Aliishimia ponticola]|uniref:Uncharacterized protein n=1 Tax=Aliishimia ponticola TaxID=2499833 RepID=A0A4S4NJH9_9RHOB|nr:hypothetical protein [Aliishimia ponticola]THH39055.1 hypothetical protein E4Z66_05720 [Aliishimia ponticola]